MYELFLQLLLLQNKVSQGLVGVLYGELRFILNVPPVNEDVPHERGACPVVISAITEMMINASLLL